MGKYIVFNNQVIALIIIPVFIVAFITPFFVIGAVGTLSFFGFTKCLNHFLLCHTCDWNASFDSFFDFFPVCFYFRCTLIRFGLDILCNLCNFACLDASADKVPQFHTITPSVTSEIVDGVLIESGLIISFTYTLVYGFSASRKSAILEMHLSFSQYCITVTTFKPLFLRLSARTVFFCHHFSIPLS